MLTNAVSNAMGRSLSFEESGEAVYAAMVKVLINFYLYSNVHVHNIIYTNVHIHIYTC